MKSEMANVRHKKNVPCVAALSTARNPHDLVESVRAWIMCFQDRQFPQRWITSSNNKIGACSSSGIDYAPPQASLLPNKKKGNK